MRHKSTEKALKQQGWTWKKAEKLITFRAKKSLVKGKLKTDVCRRPHRFQDRSWSQDKSGMRHKSTWGKSYKMQVLLYMSAYGRRKVAIWIKLCLLNLKQNLKEETWLFLQITRLPSKLHWGLFLKATGKKYKTYETVILQMFSAKEGNNSIVHTCRLNEAVTDDWCKCVCGCKMLLPHFCCSELAMS